LAEAKEGDHIVVYAGASGVGTAATQLGKLLGVNIYCVVSSEEKGKICTELGAKGVVFYKNNANWMKDLIALKGGHFNAVLDCVGSDNYESTIELLDIDGKWILFGLLSGFKTNLNLASLLAKRITLISTTLKTRSD
jgi:tumor protein p53-inducible protein 3